MYNKCVLNEKEVNDIMTCNELSRPTLVSFIGQLSGSQARQDLYTLRNETGVVVGERGELFSSALLGTMDEKLASQMLSKRSAFSAAPRGMYPYDKFTTLFAFVTL